MSNLHRRPGLDELLARADRAMAESGRLKKAVTEGLLGAYLAHDAIRQRNLTTSGSHAEQSEEHRTQMDRSRALLT